MCPPFLEASRRDVSRLFQRRRGQNVVELVLSGSFFLAMRQSLLNWRCGAWQRGFDATNGCCACSRSRGNGVGRCARRLGVLGLSGATRRLGRGPCAFRRDEGAAPRGGAAFQKLGHADPALQCRHAISGRAGTRDTESRSACRAGRTRADSDCSAAGADIAARRGNAAIIRNCAAARKAERLSGAGCAACARGREDNPRGGARGTQAPCTAARGDGGLATAGERPGITGAGRAASCHAAIRPHAGRSGKARRAVKNCRRTASACDCPGVTTRQSRTAAAGESRASASTRERGTDRHPAGRRRTAACRAAHRAVRIRASFDAANGLAHRRRGGVTGGAGQRRNRSAGFGIAAGHARQGRKAETRNDTAARRASAIQRRAAQSGERTAADHGDARPARPLRAIGADRAGHRHARHPGDAPVALCAPGTADPARSGLGHSDREHISLPQGVRARQNAYMSGVTLDRLKTRAWRTRPVGE